MLMPLAGAVGANLIANGLVNGLGAGSAPSSPAVAPAGQLGYTLQPQSNGLANGLGAGSVPSWPAVAPAGQLGYTLQPQSSAGIDYGYSLANELQPQIDQPSFMVPLVITGLTGLGTAAEQPAPASPVEKCDTCSKPPAMPDYAGQLSGPLLWAAVGALAGWVGDRGAVKGAVAGYLAALLLGVE